MSEVQPVAAAMQVMPDNVSISFSGSGILPKLNSELWNLLFAWFPSTANQCSAEMCQVPVTGGLAYLVIVAAIGLIAHEGYTTVSSAETSAGESSKEEPSDDFDTHFDQDAEEVRLFDEDDQAQAAEGPNITTEPENIGNLPDDVDASEFFDEVEQVHQRQIAAPIIRRGREGRRYQVGDKYRQVLFAHSLPDEIQIGSLYGLIADSGIQFDMSMHVEPLDRESTKDDIEGLIEDLESSAYAILSEGSDSFQAGDKQKRANNAKRIRNLIDNGQRPTKTSIYVSARGDTEEELKDNVDRLIDEFSTRADINLRTLERQQEEALISASPAGIDPMEDEPTVDPNHIVLGNGIGAMLASCSQSGVFEPTGHEFGEHARRGTPIVKDPFESETNYNMICVGESGSGKSVDMKKHALEAKAVQEDTMLVMLDPLNGFTGLAEALDAKKITISGKQSLNPLEIKKPPQDHLDSEAWDDDMDPLKAKIKDGVEFFNNFAARYNISLDDEQVLIDQMLAEAYRRQGITNDVATHDAESPTIMDLYDMGGEISESLERHDEEIDIEELKRTDTALGTVLTRDEVFVDPEGGRWIQFASREYPNGSTKYVDGFGRVWEEGNVVQKDGEEVFVEKGGQIWEDGEVYSSPWKQPGEQMEAIKQRLSTISTLLSNFGPGGTYHNLAQQTDEEIISNDDDVVYLDLSQEEGSGGTSTGVMGQLLFSMVYERAKETSKNVVFVIDEARWLLRESKTLEFLAQRIRHARHWDTSIRFITQEMDDFFEFPQAEAIVKNSSFKVIHRAPGVDSWGDKFDLNPAHKQFVKTAETGAKGYSEALVQLPGSEQWYPVMVRMSEPEMAVVDFDEQEDSKLDLPGKTSLIDESPIVREIRARIRDKDLEHEEVVEDIFDEKEQELFNVLTPEDLVTTLNQIEDDNEPRKVLYEQALKRVGQVLATTSDDEELVAELTNRMRRDLKQKYGQETSDTSAGDPDPSDTPEVDSTEEAHP